MLTLKATMENSRVTVRQFPPKCRNISLQPHQKGHGEKQNHQIYIWNLVQL